MIPVFDVGRIITFVKGLLVVGFLAAAAKLFFIGIITILVPIAIYKGLTMMMEQTMSLISDQMTNPVWSANFVQLTDLAGWLADCMRFQACFQLLASFIVARFMLTLVKKGS